MPALPTASPSLQLIGFLIRFALYKDPLAGECTNLGRDGRHRQWQLRSVGSGKRRARERLLLAVRKLLLGKATNDPLRLRAERPVEAAGEFTLPERKRK